MPRLYAACAWPGARRRTSSKILTASSARPDEQHAEVRERDHGLRVELHGLAQLALGLVAATALAEYDAEQRVRLGVARRGGDRLARRGLSLFEPARLKERRRLAHERRFGMLLRAGRLTLRRGRASPALLKRARLERRKQRERKHTTCARERRARGADGAWPQFMLIDRKSTRLN